LRSRPAWRGTEGIRRTAKQGAFFFGFFLLGKQKKESSRRAAPGEFHQDKEENCSFKMHRKIYSFDVLG